MRARWTGHEGDRRRGGATARRLLALGGISAAACGLTPERAGPSLVAEARAEEPAGQAAASGARQPPPGISLADAGAGRGARVARIDGASPAAALLRLGDRVIAADGQPIRRAGELEAHFASLGPGAPVLLELVRRGRRHLIGVQLTAAPPPPAPPPQAAAPFAPPAPPPVVVHVVQPPPVIVVIQTAPASPFVVLDGVAGVSPGWRPPAFFAPRLPSIPGATFAPTPGTSAFTYPQIPGVAQPPGLGRPTLR